MSNRARGTQRNSAVVAAVLTAALMLLSACGSDSSGGDPDEALATARAELEAAAGAHLTVICEDLPDGVSGLLGAEGILTDAPAFEGSVKLRYGGLTADIPMVSVDGTVYAQLPFTTELARIDPAEYDAPDPAQLMTGDASISRWLATATAVTQGDSVRDGRDVLTTYSGSLSGDVVADVIPKADDEASFRVTFTVDDDGKLREAEVTGAFYEGEDEVTYVVEFDDYGTQEPIRAP